MVLEHKLTVYQNRGTTRWKEEHFVAVFTFNTATYTSRNIQFVSLEM